MNEPPQAAEAARTTARARALTDAQTRGVSMDTRLAIRASDPDGYAAAFSDDIAVIWGNAQRIKAAEQLRRPAQSSGGGSPTGRMRSSRSHRCR